MPLDIVQRKMRIEAGGGTGKPANAMSEDKVAMIRQLKRQGLTHDQISMELGIHVRTVWKHLPATERGRAKFAK